MMRTLMVAVTTLLLLTSAAQSRFGGAVLLDKKDSLTKTDPGYKPDLKTLAPKVQNDQIGPKLLEFITGNPHKVYTIKLKKGEKVTITMKSVIPANPNTDVGIDTVVVVENSKKVILDFNDDTDQNTLDSTLVFTAPEDGDYRVIATSLHVAVKNKFGEYQIKITK
jgi:hypothetical protein